MSHDFSRRLWRVEVIKGGRPCLRDTGVPVEIVAERFAAGEALEALARDFGVPRTAVDEAVRLVVAATFGARGLPLKVERRMEAMVPIEQREEGTEA